MKSRLRSLPILLVTLALASCGSPNNSVVPPTVSEPVASASTGPDSRPAVGVNPSQAILQTLSTPLETKLVVPGALSGEQAGRSVAVDGDTLVIGALGAFSSQGRAHVYRWTSDAWTYEATLVASDRAGPDLFGSSVAISGNTIVVGAFGVDGDSMFNTGGAYVFTRNGTTWSQQQKLLASDRAANDRFGGSVGISGNTIVVGAENESSGGIVGNGAAYVFTRNGTTWYEQQKLRAFDAVGGDRFGYSVGISGGSIVVGAYYKRDGSLDQAGAAYVFINSYGYWYDQQKLRPGDSELYDYERFGNSVSISGDTVVVGAYQKDSGSSLNRGAAYVFTRSGGSWSEQTKLLASDRASGDQFGYSVSLSGDTLVVGAFSEDSGFTDNGAAYVFTRSGSGWSEQQKLLASDRAGNDFFGTSVGLSGDTVVVGAYLEDSGSTSDNGAVYVYRLTPPNQAPTKPANLRVSSGVNPNKIGAFTLGWDAATDPDGNPLTYTLRGQDANDGTTWTTVTSGGSGITHALTEVPAGTWTYQVRANDGTADGPFSDTLAVKVDKGAPRAPSAMFSQALQDGWHRGPLTVSFGGSTDPALPDGSTGSGNMTYSAARTLPETGEFTHSGTATDAAGNVSLPFEVRVKVDATPPTVTLAGCPANGTSVRYGSPLPITYAAGDAHSGLASEATGPLATNTQVSGPQTVTATATDKVGLTASASCTFTVGSPNGAPPTPGAPTSSTPLTKDGTFTLSWTESTDPDGGTVTYTLEGQDGDDGATWQTIPSTDLAAQLTDVAEGTWTYRVRASDGDTTSAYATATNLVKVDRRAPGKPTATPTGDKVGDWFTGDVTISYGGSTDPDLTDGTAGSGGVTFSPAQTFQVSGTHAYNGTATDAAGNVSEAVTGSVQVDRTDPTVVFSGCPTAPVAFGSAATVTFNAQDVHSGLATAASGSLTLKTDAAGGQSVSTTARDNVGRSATALCEYTVLAQNRAPGVPGAPTVGTGTNPNRAGTFTMTWAAATDPDGDALTYTLRRQDADDGTAWTTLGSGLTVLDHAQADLAEGTHVYQVRAHDAALESDFSASSAGVKVDRSAPTAPTASFSRAPVRLATGDWFSDSVTVSFTGSSDPALPDGSPGTGMAPGVLAYTAPVTFSTSGTHAFSGTAKDPLENTSTATTGTVQVDAQAPTVQLSGCPTGLVGLRTGGMLRWTASDEAQGSGLASAASGSLSLDANSVGAKTLAAPVAQDNVGHSSSAASCNYTVVYAFSGFKQPVDNLPLVNAVKAGSGVPVKFSLGGNQGLGVLNGTPIVTPIACDAADTVVPVESTTSSNSGLTYDAVGDLYTYVWKTNKAARGCAMFTLRLNDGTEHKFEVRYQ